MKSFHDCQKCKKEFEYDYDIASHLICEKCGTTLCNDCYSDNDYKCPNCEKAETKVKYNKADSKKTSNKSKYELIKFWLEDEEGNFITDGNFSSLEIALEKLKTSPYKGNFILKRYHSKFEMKITLE
jgi:hypothetical protein